MKHSLRAFVISLLLICSRSPLVGAESPAPVVKEDRSPAGALATTVSAVTGIAISPLLGTGAYGAYHWVKADTPEKKAALPWFAQISFWLPALLIVGACAAKDALGTAVPAGWKKPLDVLETVENKASGLVAAGAVVPFAMSTLSKLVVGKSVYVGGTASGLAMLGLGTIDLSWLLNILTVPFGVFMFAVVWMASHAINVLILLSPWGVIDGFLKGVRTALLGVLTITATLNPWLGAALSVVIIIVAYFVAGWSFRLTVFGTIFSWEFFTRRKSRFTPSRESNALFSASLLKKLGVPVRSYGRLSKTAQGDWLFSYRPWLIGSVKTVSVFPEQCELGRGLLFSTIREKDGTLFILPPRYRDHEEELVSLYAIPGGVRPAGVLKAWSALRDLFTGSSARVQAG